MCILDRCSRVGDAGWLRKRVCRLDCVLRRWRCYRCCRRCCRSCRWSWLYHGCTGIIPLPLRGRLGEFSVRVLNGRIHVVHEFFDLCGPLVQEITELKHGHRAVLLYAFSKALPKSPTKPSMLSLKIENLSLAPSFLRTLVIQSLMFTEALTFFYVKSPNLVPSSSGLSKDPLQ